MNEQSFAVGDVVTATVTTSLPFGVLVESAGVPGLVRGAQSESGAELRLRVIEFDAERRRFSGEPV